MPRETDAVVVGGGIIGLAVADALTAAGRTVSVLEKEAAVATHQTSHNSGVVHAGVYYRPGSLKAELCSSGRLLLRDFCEEQGIAYDPCGKVIVATTAAEVAELDAIERRAEANRVPGLQRLGPDGLAEIEPHVRGRAALWSPTTAIVDFSAVARALAAAVAARGGRVVRGATVTGIGCEGGLVLSLIHI